MNNLLIILLLFVAESAWAGFTNQTPAFDYYLLSLSWSPTYCASHSNDTKQCGSKGYGLVLHGLWPQYAKGGFPDSCSSRESLSASDRAFANSIFPNPKLVNHEWLKHGTCTGLSANAYFKAANQAWTTFKIPKVLEQQLVVQYKKPNEIVSAIIKANPEVPSNGVSVVCSGNEFSEVRVCLDRGLKPITCGQGLIKSCGDKLLRIRSVR